MRAGLGGAAGLALAACSRSGDPARAAGPAPEPPVSAQPLPPAAVPPADPTASALPTPAPTPPAASVPVASATAPRAQPVHRLDEIMPAAPANAVALTIDDGPDDWYTPQVLKLLDRYGVQATFCVIGIYAAAFPELVSRIANAGHTICHHSMTHQQPFNRLSAGRLAEEIERPMPILERATGIRPLLFRPPGGAWSPQIAEAVAASELTPSTGASTRRTGPSQGRRRSYPDAGRHGRRHRALPRQWRRPKPNGARAGYSDPDAAAARVDLRPAVGALS